MALDRRKKLENAERLLKQGKVQAALVDLEDLANTAPGDLLTMNRMGDLLAKQGRHKEAIRFYQRIAAQFSQGGFIPKAIAIHKKILRLDPDCVEAFASLGELYRLQKLPGEARSYLLQAAQHYLEERDFARARHVYENLVAAEPGDPRHRARLAEARAAEGETAKAGEDLVALAETLLAGGSATDAERAYRRALELTPQNPQALVGIARSLEKQGQENEAVALLEAKESGAASSPEVLGELIVLYERLRRSEDTLAKLKLPLARSVPEGAFLRVFRWHHERGQVDEAWERFGAFFDSWAAEGQSDGLATVYGRLGELDEQGHVPALERLLALHETSAEPTARSAIVDELVRAYRATDQVDEADALVERFGKVEPSPPQAADSAPGAELEPKAAPRDGVSDGEAAIAPPIEAEAPAVPLNPADREFVTGRLTQAEILEKYGLREQALQQIREITERFPGHVDGQERLVLILRDGAAPEELRDALVGLALAQRASGDAEGARKAAGEATLVCPLAESTRQTLDRLGLMSAPPAMSVAVPASRVAEARPDAAAVTIDFDGGEDMPVEQVAAIPAPSPPAPPPTPRRGPTRKPSSDMLKEIDRLVAEGKKDEARKRIEALLTLGYYSPALERVRAQVVAPAPQTVADPAPVVPVQPAAAPEPVAAAPPVATAPSVEVDLPSEPAESVGATADIVEDDDLSAITAALESELFAEDPDASVPNPEAEQSLEDVFAAFRERVDEEVGADDYRTHYDLGIAYKEMGLIDEAIQEFRHVLDSPDLKRESYAMLALCHRERSESDEAANCYRQAIANSNGDASMLSNLRYELAELLLGSGDRKGALSEFRHVLNDDPSFRDVQDRVTALES